MIEGLKRFDGYATEGDALFGMKDGEWIKILEINQSSFNFPATALHEIACFLTQGRVE